MKTLNIFLSIFILFFLSACQSDKFDIDVSHVEIDLEILRFDQDLFDEGDASEHVPKWQEKYGHFLEMYSYKIVQLGGANEQHFSYGMAEFKRFLTDNKVQEAVGAEFPDLDSIRQELNQAFRYYKHYFPEKDVPKIIFMYSGFNQSVVTDSGLVAVSLDKYLGANYDLYSQMGFDNYLRRKMDKKMMVVDIMRAWFNMEFEFELAVDNMLSYMVYEGKIQYLLNACLPNTPAPLKFGYSEVKYDWAVRNEKNMWDYMVEHKVIFSSERMDIKKYIGDAPFTAPFMNISAPRAGVWIGAGIVHAYMDHFPDKTLQQLMSEHDYQNILTLSKYKP